MRLIALPLTLWTAVASAQQTLDRRVASAPDGTVRFAYAARAGVCGDGRSFIGDDAPGSHGFRTWVFHGSVSSMGRSPDWRSTCLPGPAWIVLSKAGPRITRLDVFVGPELRVTAPGADLGRVSAAAAAVWLLDLAESEPADHVTSRAFLAAALADSARLSERLIQIARNRARRAYVRERAVRWLAEAAEREGTAPAADAALQAIAGDEADARTVRERAIRALGELDRHDRLIALYAELTDVTLKERVIRLVGERGDPAGLRWLRTIAEDGAQYSRLRDRALRVLGEQGQSSYLRDLYPRLEGAALKERVIRTLAESGASGDQAWLLQRVLDGAEDRRVRDRALRSWAEWAGSPELRSLYSRLTEHALQERLVRLLGERGDDEAVDKLIAIARSDPDGDLRRLAIRRLAQSGHPKARSFLEETVRR